MISTVPGNYPKIANRRGGQTLRRAIASFDRGRISADELAAAADEVTIEVIGEQERAGIDVIADGQIRWQDPVTYIAGKLDGYEIGGLIRYFDTNTFYRQPEATGRIAWQGPILVHDYEFARDHASGPVKPVVTGPYTIAKLSLLGSYAVSDEVVDLQTLVLDTARALNQEMKALAATDPPLIQVDEPAIVWHRYKGDWAIFKEAMDVLMDGVGATTLLRTDFGDAVGLPDFFALPFQGFGLDMVHGKGNLALVPEFPDDRDLMLGIIDARNVRMETEEAVLESVRYATEHVCRERLAISPNTGLEFLPRETAYDKLQNMVHAVKKAQEAVA
ncbi:MAG: methylcobamide--CoM methyltransferase [Chloroflexi bacterium]|nr:methylcobamide--CoM methyltransferase [Chloroflexota bacterium]